MANARLIWRGGRAVDCAGLENRKAARPREFESHPLRFPHGTIKTTQYARAKEASRNQSNLRGCDLVSLSECLGSVGISYDRISPNYPSVEYLTSERLTVSVSDNVVRFAYC
jgi:hypothetical protein